MCYTKPDQTTIARAACAAAAATCLTMHHAAATILTSMFNAQRSAHALAAATRKTQQCLTQCSMDPATNAHTLWAWGSLGGVAWQAQEASPSPELGSAATRCAAELLAGLRP